MPDSLRVIAHLKAKDGQADRLRSLLAGLIEPTHQEPGCLHYELWQSRDNPEELTFVESWQDQAALDAHFETDHIQSALAELPDVLEGELDLRRYTKVAGGAVRDPS